MLLGLLCVIVSFAGSYDARFNESDWFQALQAEAGHPPLTERDAAVQESILGICLALVGMSLIFYGRWKIR